MWGTLLNTNFSLIDSAVAGLLSLSVAGSANVVLTTTNGAADQARNAMFVFSGVLTGNINVLWPASKTAVFSVKNSTTGSFTLSLGANNGSSLPAGAVAVIPQGGTGVFYSDGTNVYVRVTAGGIGALLATNNLSDLVSASTARTNLGLLSGATTTVANGATTTINIQNGGSPSGGANGDLFFIY